MHAGAAGGLQPVPDVAAPRPNTVLSQTEKSTLGKALVEAAVQGKWETVPELLRQGAPVDAENTNGWTALIYAAKAGNAPVVHDLILRGVDVNHRSSTAIGSTVLCFALEGNNLAVVKDLLDHGADVNGQARNGMTPLIYAVARGDIELKDQIAMLELLLKRGAHLETPNNSGNTALMEAAKRPVPAIVQFLVSKGANVNARGPRGHTALIYAGYNGRVETLKLLVAAGADPFAMASDFDNSEESSRYGGENLAKQQGHPGAAAVIQEAKAQQSFSEFK